MSLAWRVSRSALGMIRSVGRGMVSSPPPFSCQPESSLTHLATSAHVFSVQVCSGFEVIRWLGEEHHLALLVAVFFLRMAATTFTLAGGGVGGVFIPLVVGGAIVGRAVGEIVEPLDPTLYTLLGIAAFLGAGYRVPLAAVMFVAETTGQPGFIVPALFAAVAAELVMGDVSVTTFQRTPEQDR